MGETLKRRLRQSRFESPHQEAFLNLLVATASVRAGFEKTCNEHGITEGQYNVLRILRGNNEGYARCEISERMVERAPDVTRLIDRLEAQELVERARSESDRRRSITRITRRGLQLLDQMQAAISGIHEDLGRRISARDARELSRICEAIYASDLD